MLLSSTIRRKILSLLQPWLREEPQLDLKLGFFYSLAVITNLRFDAFALNKLFHSPPLLFIKDLTVERLVVRFSTWSPPAFYIEFHGVEVVLAFENPEEDECVRRLQIPPKYDYSDDLRKKLSEFDPEGCSFHQILETILFAVHEKKSFTSSFLNFILKNCHLEVHHVHVDVQFPILNSKYACFGEIKEFSAKSTYLDKKCLLRSFVNSVFVPVKESSFVLDGTGLKVGLNGKNHTHGATISSDMKSFIKFRDLKLVDCTLCFPELTCAFSPDDLPLCLLFDKLLSNKFNQTRSARELWKIASSRIDRVIVTPRFSLQRLVGVIGQWTHYVKAYEKILLLTGYSTGNIWKKSFSKMSYDNLSSAKHHWELISDIEKKLPVEGISLARRIARHRAALKIPFDCHEKCAATRNFFHPLLFIVAFMWEMISKVIHFLGDIFFAGKKVQAPEIDGLCLGSLIKDPCQSSCFVLNFGKIIMTVSRTNEIHASVGETLQSDTGVAYLNILSICFCINSLLLVSVKDILEQRVFLSCGQMKAELTPSTMSAEESTLSMLSYTEGKGKVGSHDMKSLMWIEPAKRFPLSETNTVQSEDSFDFHIESFMGKLSVSWEEISSNFNESEIQYSQNPCLLSKIETSSSYSDHRNPDNGFCECGLLVGKLNLFFSCSSISSLSLILSQLQHAVYCEEGKEVCTVSNLLDKTENDWVEKYECFSKKMILAMLQKLPERDIHFGVFVDGPSVRFSHRSEANISGQGTNDTSSQEDFDLILDFHEIEVIAGSPPSLVGMTLLTGQSGLDDTKTECITLEPRVIEIPKPNNDKYASVGKISIGFYLHLNGLNAFLEKSTNDHQIQLLILKPITVQMLCIRDFIFSLSRKMSAFSAALDITAGGFTVLSFLDEVYMIYKAIAKFSSEVSYLFRSFEDVDCTHPEIMKWEAFFAVLDSNGAIIPGGLQTNDIFPFFIDGTCRFNSVDVILHNSRTSDNLERNTRKFDILAGNRKAMKTLPDCGIWISIQQAITVISCEEAKLDFLIDLSGIMSSVFEYQKSIGNNHENIVLQSLLLRSVNCLHEISLSGGIFTLCLGLVQNTPSSGNGIKTFGSSEGSTSHLVQETNLSVFERSSNQAPLIVKKMAPPTNISMQDSASHWLVINVAVCNIFIGRCSMKSDLLRAHKVNKLLSLVSIGGDFNMIFWEIQGGLIVLETLSLPMAIDNYSLYLHCIGNLTSVAQQHDKSINLAEDGRESYNLDIEIDQGIVGTSQQAESGLPDAFDISLSHFALVLALENESGGIQEIVLEVDIRLTFNLRTTGMKLTVELSRLLILSQVIHERVEKEMIIPHFSSVTSKGLASHLASADPFSGFPNFSELNSDIDASSSRDPTPVQLSRQNQILQNLRASISLEKPDNDSLHFFGYWFGVGRLSGFDMTLSVYEIQTISSMASSFSGTSSHNTTEASEKNHWSSSQVDNNFEAIVPDGAIVAIQDANQHMYFTVDGEENSFRIGGAIHYSLAGERALFRVKHCFQKGWTSTVLWFSLVSLFAKNDMGVPLRLNYRPGSCFVDISCTNDGGCALWRVYPPEAENYEGVTDLEAFNQSEKRAFYLENKMNSSAIAFVDGTLEFVKKPGSPIKFKVFNDLSVTNDVSETASYPRMAMQSSLPTDEESTSSLGGKFPCIDFKIEKISLNIVHELSDTDDHFPLICLSLNDTQLTVQILATKYRVISTSSASINYFDAQRNLWGEVLHPVEISIFYRSNVQAQLSEYASRTVPTNFFCRIKELDISLNENSLDVLLFMIGELKLSGPYSLQSSVILANFCKVENQSGLNLLFHFDQQRVTIPRKQSASILLRRLCDFKIQDLETAISVSIQLADGGSFATSPIRLLLPQTQTLAWKTQIMSREGSRTFPGPMLVVNISRNSEVGLSFVVSPLIKIHNGTGFSMELQFQRPAPMEDEFASVLLKPGDCIDDSMAIFDAINFSGGVKRALMSMSVGNFLFACRPKMTEEFSNSETSLSLEWSDYIKGGKAVRLTGVFEKLNYKVRQALFVKSVKCSFSTVHCKLMSEGLCVSDMHFLIQTIAKDIPITQPEKSATVLKNGNSKVSLLEQKEIYLLPTVRLTNLLHSDIDVLLSETDQLNLVGYEKIGKQARISCGSTADFYANPAVIYFTVTLTSSNSSSKPVNSKDFVKKLLKQNTEVQHLDINLNFDGGKFSATLRLYRGNRGVLEVVVFTSYSMKNETDLPIYVLATKRWPLSRVELENLNSNIPSEIGLCLLPKSTRSWFLKSERVQLKLPEDHTSEAPLDLGSLSGLTEISFKKEEGSGIKSVTKLGVSIGPSLGDIVVPSQTVTLVPRYVICNESEQCITVRQYYFQDEVAGVISIDSKQKMSLPLKEGLSKKREFSVFERLIRKHRIDSDNSLLYIQFQTNEPGLGWSGPVCLASLGHFFLKFRKEDTASGSRMIQFAAVHVVEEGSTLVLSFYKPPNLSLPYRIQNCLPNVSITYYQKGSLEPEVLGPAGSADYVWDDLTLPRRLVVRINDSLQLREIKLDKVRTWRAFYKLGQQRVLATRLLSDKRSRDQISEPDAFEITKVGYEIYAEGPTRVLRICEISDSFKKDAALDLYAKFQLRVSRLAVHVLEHVTQEDENEHKDFTPIVVVKLENLHMVTVSNNHQKYNQLSIQYMNLELKRTGAPFASMLRRHQLDCSEPNDSVLKVVFVILASSSNVKQFRYSSIFLQPMDLNLDEETLMKLASFWRTSLSDSESQRIYFDHFEIHPIKIIANFIPGESHSTYSSSQEALRSLIHSVVKVPSIKNMVVELNGVLITHALITMRELFIKCAQHYSWYAMRAIYIAKGSPLLPPDFVSIFDDLASSSLDVFFDPSHRLPNLPGLTLGTFKLISKCVKGEGFSGTKRYFGDLGKTLKSAGSNIAFAAVAEISDSILRGAEANGFDGLMSGFHQGILKLAMEPSVLGTALMEGGSDRKILLDQSPGVDELYIEGYIQAMLDTVYRQEYLRVRVIDNQVILKNLPPNLSLINDITDHVKEFLVSKALLKGDPSTISHPLRRLRGETEWRIGPTLLTLCEHLFVSFAIRILRKQANKFVLSIKPEKQPEVGDHADEPANSIIQKVQKVNFIKKWGIAKFILSGLLAYIDGRLCRRIPNPVVRRVVSGFMLSYIDHNDEK